MIASTGEIQKYDTEKARRKNVSFYKWLHGEGLCIFCIKLSQVDSLKLQNLFTRKSLALVQFYFSDGENF